MTEQAPDPPGAEGMELVMPFIACTSVGGAYEDVSFVAGFTAGQINQALAAIAAAEGDGYTATVPADLLPQLDLIAMRHGFHHVEIRDAGDGWAFWRANRFAPTPAGETP